MGKVVADDSGITPSRRRDFALDLLRGYFLVVIVIDHLRFASNPLYLLSGKQSLWVTAAEGFVLISGFLVGMLRGDEARHDGLTIAARHLLRRAGVLALWCALMTIGFRAISELTGYWPAVPNADAPGTFAEYSVGAMLLRLTYGDHNLLAAYAIYLAAAPLALGAMLRGHTATVLAASITLWGIAYRYQLAWSNSVQADLCWQLLFVVGMAAGFHRAEIGRRWRALSPQARGAVPVVAALAVSGIIVGSLVRFPEGHHYSTHFEGFAFDRDRLGPGRAACAVVFVASLYMLARTFEQRLVPTVGRLLIPLGQASLYVYIVQSIATFTLVDRTLDDPWQALVITTTVVVAIWLMVKHRVLFRVIPR